jgi:pectin lyase
LAGGKVVAEGNYFQSVTTPLLENKGAFFGSPSTSANTACKTGLGHNCLMNTFVSSGKLGGTDTAFISTVKGQPIASVSAASTNIKNLAGVGRI